MSMTADHIVDRRRIRRKLTFWRIFAFVLALLTIGAVYFSTMRGTAAVPGSNYIARLTFKGLIRGDLDRVKSIERLAESRAKAVIIHVDSPGGTTAGSEQLYDAIRRLAEKKPVVVVVDSLAASGGYILAMAGDHIVAQSNSIVGSIGVLAQFPNVSELMKTLGIRVDSVKSSPLKAAPDPFEPTSPEARAALQSVVMDAYAWFRNMVQERRKLAGPALERVADGRVFTGRQAIELRLVDELGDEKTALAYLARERGVDAKLPVRDWRLQSRLSQLPFLHLAAAATLDAVGLGWLAQRIHDSAAVQAMERMNLDGILTLWHPPGTN